MKKFRGKRILSIFMVAIMGLSIAYSPLLADKAEATCASGIKGNGTNGVSININAAPYTTFATYNYGDAAYGPSGCSWFASARANQITGWGSTIWSGYSWFFNQPNYYGYGSGSIPREKALACYDNHVAVVEKVNGNTITLSEGGAKDGVSDASHGYCIIHNLPRSTVESSRPGCGDFLGYVYLTSGVEEPIGTPSILTNQLWYDLQDTIQVKVNAANATSYYVAVFKDNNKIYEGHCPNAELSFAANTHGKGQYALYFTCYNSKYSKDSEWINFKVVGAPSYTSVSSSKERYQLDENVTLKVSTVTAKGQVIGIDKKKADGSWERVVTKDVPSEYTFKASSLGAGTYSAYFSVYNGSGGVDTTRINFSIGTNNTADCQHKWNNGTVTKAATCTSAGVKTFKCTNCTATKTEPIPKSNHNFGEFVTTTKAKFGKNGVQTATCTTCKGKTTKSIAAPKTMKLSATAYTYNGKVKKPTVAVYDSKGKKISSANYTVSYASGRKNVGKYKVTVSFKTSSASYTGSKYKTFKINPKGTSISKISAAKKAFTVKWKKPSSTYRKQMTGYQIRYSTLSKMSKAKTVTVKSTKATSKKISKLKAKKTYYVQLRTYKTVKGTKYYSGWSKTKKVKVK